METGKYSYKGFDYTVEFTNWEGWRNNKNKFFASGSLFSSDYCTEFDKAVDQFKSQVDTFLKDQPKTVDELVDKLSKLLIWTGYEDCDFDTVTAKMLIESFIKTAKK